MNIPAYISPSGFKTFNEDPKLYYLRYLSPNKLARTGQNIHMAVGSAFDAFVKAQLTNDLQTEDRFDLKELFEAQVEEQHRDVCWDYGAFLLQEYKKSGAYGVAISDMGIANLAPRFEFDISAEILGVPVFGKPDAYYINKDDVVVILDWKVNTFITGKNSKKRYYVIDHETGEAHPQVVVRDVGGLPISVNYFLEDVFKDWAFQQFVYAIGLGSKIGDPFITSIDQVTGPKPSFYTYRAYLSKPYQIKAAKELKDVWDHIVDGFPFYKVMSREENDTLIANLEGPMRDMYM